MSERPTQAEIDESYINACKNDSPNFRDMIDEANSTHAQEVEEQEVPVIWDGTPLVDCITKLRREACGAWSDVRGIDGNIDEAKCQYAAAIEERLKCAIEDLIAHNTKLRAKDAATIVQLKERIDQLQHIIDEEAKDSGKVIIELSSSQEQVKMLRGALQDLKDEGVLKHSIIDKALAATAPKGE